jgi:hypothetical protein
MVDAQSILMLQETYTTTLVFLPMWYWDKTTAPSLLSQAGWGVSGAAGSSKVEITL